MTARTCVVSVVVPFRNGADQLRELLASLVRQDFDEPWEIVAVDNGSSDGAAEVARSFSGRLPIVVMSAPERQNPAFARNSGTRQARADRFLFIDADDTVATGYVSAMVRALEIHPLVTSRVDSTALNAEWVREAHGPPWQQERIGPFLGFLPGTGANIGIRRELFETIGRFDEGLHGSEDLALSWSAQIQAGVAPHFVVDALYRYRYRASYAGLFRQGVTWGRDHVRLYNRFRRHGMPGRPFRKSAGEWLDVALGLTVAPKKSRPALVVRLGCCSGRLLGSVKDGVAYL